MSATGWWWIAGAILIGAEMLTGTFYLLVVGVAVALGGVAAWAGAEVPVQWLTAGLLGVAGTVLLQRWKRGQPPPSAQQSLDVGHMVQVQHWDPNGRARVSYRGSSWDAELETPTTVSAKTMYIVAMRGSTLILSDRLPAKT